MPATDPTSIFEHFRGAYATELLTAAVAHFKLFDRLADGALSETELARQLELSPRPMVVLTTALRAMGLLTCDSTGRFILTNVAREHLLSTSPLSVADYVGLAAGSPGVVEMVTRLKTNRPAHANDEQGAAFIYKEGTESAMEREASARALTLALAGRANNVAPRLAAVAPLEGAKLIVDVGGGTGIYSIALLKRFPALKAIILDRPEVLKVAAEFAAEHGVSDRIECWPSDMFADRIPSADAVLLSNILHDWDVPECQTLVQRCAKAVFRGGQVLIHDVFLNDALDGPLPIALYSAALFTLTEGRAYSAAEYRTWLTEAGLTPQPVVSTHIHCGLLAGIR